MKRERRGKKWVNEAGSAAGAVVGVAIEKKQDGAGRGRVTMPLPPPRKATTTGRLAVARATSPSKVKASGSECLRAGLPDSQIKASHAECRHRRNEEEEEE
ncbi:hypothetical protein MRX96_055347 [Rhipicephalus microplus]